MPWKNATASLLSGTADGMQWWPCRGTVGWRLAPSLPYGPSSAL